MTRAVTGTPQDALAWQRRSFRRAALALGAVAIAFVAMAGLQTFQSSWTQHGREMNRLVRDIRATTYALRGALREQMLRGGDDSAAARAQSDRALTAMLDTLVRLTADNPTQHARARAIQNAEMVWRGNGRGVAEALAAAGDRDAVLELERRRFEFLSTRVGEFVVAEETLYQRRVAQERLAERGTAAGMVVGLVLLLFGLRGMRRRMHDQIAHIVSLADTTTRQNAELMVQGEQLSHQNEELRLQTEQLQDQAATLQENEAELEATLDEMRTNQEHFHIVVNSMPDMVYTVDRDQRLVELYGGWVEREGLDGAVIIGRHPAELFGHAAATEHRKAHDVALGGVPTLYEWTTQNGSAPRHFTTAVAPLRTGNGEVTGAVGVTRDVTEQRELEKQHRATEEQLRHTQRLDAIGQLAGGVAHDFNNLLTVVLSYCDILEMDLGSASGAGAMLAQIRHAALQGAKLTSQLLAAGRQQVMRLDLLDLNVVVRRTEEMLRRLIDASISLHLRLAPERAIVLADATQVEQILINLVINSRDAMPHGGTITVVTSNDAIGPDDAAKAGVSSSEFAALEVIDTGTGMSAEVRDRIFEPFFTTKAVGKGTGLGLATVHGIVRQSGGQIEVLSEMGRGTTVRVMLPRAEASAEDIARIRDAEPAPHAAPLDLRPRGVTPMAPAAAVTGTVLLVDDDEAVRQVATQLLAREGHVVIAVDSAIDALHVLEKREQHIDLVLSDVVMPHMSGRELAYEVRIRFPQAVIVLMSGYSKERVLSDDALGSDTLFLDKPFTREAFLAAVRSGMAATRRAARATTPTPGAGQSEERPVTVIVNSLDAVVWEADARTGRLHYVNRRAETLLGYPLSRWLEAGFFESIIHAEDKPRALALRADAMRTGAAFAADYRVRNAAGGTTWLHDQVRPALGANGRVTHFRGVTIDVTAVKEAERDLVRAKEVAERASQAKSQFLSLISHELRTPLTAVIGFAGVLRKNRRGMLDAGDLTYLDRITANGQALLRLVDTMLELTSMEAGAADVAAESMSLQQTIPEALAEFEERARASSLTLRSHVDEHIAPVHADPAMMRSLIGKLVDNGLKFTSTGGIEVRVVADADGRTARRIEVSDTGIGVEPELLEAMFAPFEQSGQFTVRRHGGTGLGLHLARRYCELMGYSLSVKSTPGVGSTFSIDLRPAT